MRIESEQETDGRWLAEAPELRGILAYGASQDEAIRNVENLAWRVRAERADLDAFDRIMNRIGEVEPKACDRLD